MMHITLVFAVCADGTACRPTAILPGLQNFPQDLEEFKDKLYWTSSSSGYISKDLFASWVELVFIPDVTAKRIIHQKPQQKVLLWLDGHTSRGVPEALQHFLKIM